MFLVLFVLLYIINFIFIHFTGQTGQTQTPEGDSWNWGWGDEDNSNMLTSQQQQPATGNEHKQPVHITDSFSNNESWNWNVDNTASQQAELKQSLEPSPDDPETSFPQMGKLADKHRKLSKSELNTPEQTMGTIENLPSTLMGKRNKMDHLTPQWSLESQMSQDSSDEIAHTSESDKSRMISRSSTISQSPVSGHDANLESLNNLQHDNVSPLQEAYGQSNLENIESPFAAPPLKKNVTPPPPIKNITPPLNMPPPMKNNTPPLNMPPPMKNNTPPLNMPPTDTSKNPYQRNTGLQSHKTANKTRSQDNFYSGAASNYPNSNYSATNNQSHFTNPTNSYPQQNFPPVFNQSVNLESPPDNSEQPDTMPSQHLRKPSHGKAMPYLENQEVAPMNDRNQYLETGQLSDDNNLQVDALPPPGMRRVIPGQMEQDSDTNPPQGSDEPPPNFSRMVLGQTESSSSLLNNVGGSDFSAGPPVGLDRMVPGESR